MASRALQLRIQEAERSLRTLQDQAVQLEAKLEALKRSLEREETEAAATASPATAKSPVPEAKPAATPPPLPPKPVCSSLVDPAPVADAPAPNPIAAAPKTPEPSATPEPAPAPAPVASQTTANEEEREGLELALGRVWFVRIGIGFLLTGFVFLSTYAYQNFIINWAPGARVAALYALAVLLTATGFFLERWKDSLRNYGRVVAAGGWAAAYYTTYAAHHVDHLRIIPGATTAAVLLGVCALGFFTYAAWKRSSILTVAALLMAFYSVAINPMGTLGCFSGLLLSAIGVFFLVRFQWMHTGFTALAGAYLSYAYWQGLVNVDGANDTTRWFLVGYWVLFTTAVLVHDGKEQHANHLTALASLNNAAFFILFSFNFARLEWVPDIWRIALVFGGILLVFSAAVSRFPRFPARLWHVVLPQGLALITWGLSIKLTGHHLFISLTLEALVLAVLWKRTQVPTFRAFAWIAATIGIFAALKDAHAFSHAFLIEGFLLAGFSWLMRGEPFLEGKGKELSIESIIASSFALLIPALGVLGHLETPVAGLWMLGTGLILWLGLLALPAKWPVPELSWLSQAFAAVGAAFVCFGDANVLQLSLATALCVAFFHLHAYATTPDRSASLPELSTIAEAVFTGFFLTSLGILITTAFDSDNTRLALFAAAPLLLHAYGSLAGRPILSILTQAFYIPVLILSMFGWQTYGANISPAGTFLLVAIGLVAVHLVLVHLWESLHFRQILQNALLVLLAGLWTGWNVTHVDAWWLVLVWTAFAVFFVPASFRAHLHIATAATLLVLGLLGTTFHDASEFILRYLAVAAPLAIHLLSSPAQQTAGHGPWFRIWDALAAGTVVALAVVVSQHTLHVFDGNGLSICWTILGFAMFGLGLTTKHRVYRLCGLILLAMALGHILCIDVWKLGTLLRILSFLTVGLTLLALGFVYNRYHEKLRHLL